MLARRGVAALVVFALLTAACSGGGGESERADTTTRQRPSTRCIDATPTPVAKLDHLDDPIELDDAIDRRVLDNGLTVYVRKNAAPGGRGEISLAVRAGSVHETDEQSGAAHFLEHMLFNGTERWPGNELVQELERFGSAIGPDLNAYTSYEETVYLLSLPSVDRETRELGVDVLREWAARATLDQNEVEAERGVVLEELRSSKESAGGRIGDIFEQWAHRDTPFAGRLPIGERDAVAEMEREPLLEFYEDWYQLEHMAVVAVGDFDVARMHELIEARFEDLPGEAGAAQPDLIVEPWPEPRYEAVTEPELPRASATVGYTIAPPDPTSGLGVREAVIQDVAFELVALSLQDDLERGVIPLLEASSSSEFPISALRGLSIDIGASSEGLREAIASTIREMEHACRFGFTEAQLDRVLRQRRASLEQEFALTDSKQDAHHAAELRSHFLVGAAVPDGDARHELHLAILDSITADDVTAWFGDLYGSMPPSVFAVGLADQHVPSVEDLASLAADAEDLDLEEREEAAATEGDLMARPEPVAPTSRTVIEEFERTSLGAVELAFPNGARVILQESDIAVGTIALGAISQGGTSLLDDDDVMAAQLVGDILASSGAGDLDQVELRTLLADRSIELWFSVEPEIETVDGFAAAKDLEVLLQLLHLQMTDPRVSDTAVATAVSNVLPVAKDPLMEPSFASTANVLTARVGDEIRYSYLGDPESIEDLTAPQVEQVARDRFGTGGDFTFVLVGDVKLEEMEALAASYLGTLPGGEAEAWVNVLPEPPEGVKVSTVRAGSGDQGGLMLLYEVRVRVDNAVRMTLPVVAAVVDTRLREVIREELGATYSPFIDIGVEYSPFEHAYAWISIDGDPAGIEELSRVVKAELASIAAGEISEDELRRAVSTVSNDFDLWSNELLVDLHRDRSLSSTLDYAAFLQRSAAVRRIDADNVAAVASRLFDPEQHVEGRLLPAQS